MKDLCWEIINFVSLQNILPPCIVSVLITAATVQTQTNDETLSNLLQDLPDFLVEADRDSVQGSIQTPPAEPLAVSRILDPGNDLWNIQGFYGGQPVPLNRQGDELKDLDRTFHCNINDKCKCRGERNVRKQQLSSVRNMAIFTPDSMFSISREWDLMLWEANPAGKRRGGENMAKWKTHG